AKVRSRGSYRRTGRPTGIRAGRRGHHLKTASSCIPSQGRRLEAVLRQVLVVRNLRGNEKRRRFEIDQPVCEILPPQIQAAVAVRKPNGIVARSVAPSISVPFPGLPTIHSQILWLPEPRLPDRERSGDSFIQKHQ